MTGENGFAEWKNLILDKLDSSAASIEELRKEVSDLTISLAGIRTLKVTCSENVAAQLADVRGTANRAHIRVDDLERQIDRAKTSASAVKAAAIVVTSIVATGFGIWAWISQHLVITHIKP